MTESQPINHVVALVNDAASNARRVHKQLDALSVPCTRLTMSLDPLENIDRIDEVRADCSAVLIGSGDGGYNNYLNAMYSPEGEQAGLCDIPTGALRGGNACDIARDLNGFSTAARLLTASQVQLLPLEVAVNDAEKRYVQNYVSFGGTAEATAAIDKLKLDLPRPLRHPLLRFLPEAYVSWAATADFPAFTVQLGNDMVEATNVLLARGGVMAKIGRPHGIAREPAFETLIMKSRGRIHTLSEMLKMAGGSLWGTMGDHVSFSVSSRDGTDLPVQYDGEFDQIASGSVIEATIVERGYTALVSRH